MKTRKRSRRTIPFPELAPILTVDELIRLWRIANRLVEAVEDVLE